MLQKKCCFFNPVCQVRRYGIVDLMQEIFDGDAPYDYCGMSFENWYYIQG